MQGPKLWQVFLVAGLLVSCGAVDPGPGMQQEAGAPPTKAPDPGEPPQPRADGPLEAGASVADGDVSAAASEIVRELWGDDQFASLEVIDRTKIVLYWFGAHTPQMQDVIGNFPQLDITIEEVPYSPGHVRRFGAALFQSDPDVRGFSLERDGSRATVMLDPSRQATTDVSALQRQYSEAAGCPVEVSFGRVEPTL